MQSSRIALLLSLLLLLTACQTRPAADAPSTATTAPAPAEAPAPAPTAPAAKAKPAGPSFCDPDYQRAAEENEALRAYVAAALQGLSPADVAARIKQDPAGCLTAEKGERTDIYLISTYKSSYRPAVVAWQEGGSWRVTPVGAKIFIPDLGLDAFTEGRPDLLLISRSGGTAGGVMLFHYRVRPDGQPEVTDLKASWGKAGLEFLSKEWILATYRNQLWNQFSASCNGCVPSLEQDLLRWDGQKLTKVATRTQANPELTLNLIRQALRNNDYPKAYRYLGNEKLTAPLRVALHTDDKNPGYQDYAPYNSPVAQVEEHNWDALPPEFRTPLPPALLTDFVATQVEYGSIIIQMERRESGWVVTALNASDSAARPLPASEREAIDALRKLDTASPATAVQALRSAVLPTLSYLGTPMSNSSLPHVTLLPLDGEMRLVHLGGRASDLLQAGWTWIQWQDGRIRRTQELRLGEAWKPEQTAWLGDGHFAVVWRELVPPFRSSLNVYSLSSTGQWISLFSAFTPAGSGVQRVPYDRNDPYLLSKDGSTIALTDSGRTLKLCAQGGSPCLTAKWMNVSKKYVEQP